MHQHVVSFGMIKTNPFRLEMGTKSDPRERGLTKLSAPS